MWYQIKILIQYKLLGFLDFRATGKNGKIFHLKGDISCEQSVISQGTYESGSIENSWDPFIFLYHFNSMHNFSCSDFSQQLHLHFTHFPTFTLLSGKHFLCKVKAVLLTFVL